MLSDTPLVDILGYFGKGNSGDEAFKDAHKTILETNNINFCSSLLNIRSPSSHYPTAILGGGDVVAPFFLDKIPLGRKFIMYSVGLKYEQSSIDAIMNRKDDIVYTFFRNRVDVDLCNKAGIYNCEYAPDMVFALANSYASTDCHRLIPELSPKDNYIIVCLADHYNYSLANRDLAHSLNIEKRKSELAKALDVLADENLIVFFPLSCYKNHMDHRFHFDVWRLMLKRQRCAFIKRAVSPLEAIGFFSSSAAVVSMKLHGNIYGLVASTPTVNIGVGRKQRLLFDEAGLNKQYVPDENFSSDRILEALQEAFSSRARINAENLKQDYCKKVLSTRQKLLDLLDK